MRRIALLTVVFALACSSREGELQRPRAVVIALDGADWAVIDRLAEAGDLPNLSHLQEIGVRAHLDTLADIPLSPAIWTSIATGKEPDDHGISWFFNRASDGSPTPVRSTDRRVSAIWNILARRQKRVGVVGWWATYPPEAIGDGVMVSDALGYHGFGRIRGASIEHPQVYPAELEDPLSSLVIEPNQLSDDFVRRFIDLTPEQYYDLRSAVEPLRGSGPADPVRLFERYAVTARGYADISERLLEERDFDLFMVYFEQIDSISHLFMKYAPPQLDWIEDEAYSRHRNAVSRWYGYQDQIIGRLLAQIDLKTTAVFVVSDHGFKSGDRRIRGDGDVDTARAHLEHEPNGIFLAAGPGLRAGARARSASVLDVTPTLLHYLDLPVAEDMAGRVFEEIFTEHHKTGRPVRYLPTYETGQQQPAPLEPEIDPEQSERYLAALEALGYLGSPGGVAESPPPRQSSRRSPQMLINQGQLKMAKGDFDAAQARFLDALAIDPDNAEALLGLSAVERVFGRVLAAEELIERALMADPDSVMALGHMAEIERDYGRLEEATRLYERAIGIGGGQPYLYIGLGDILQRSGRNREAIEAFEKALELDPDSAKAHYNLAVTYSAMGLIEEARRSYERCLKMNPDSEVAADANNNLGILAQREGDRETARTRFEKAVDLWPLHFEARFNLAMAYLEVSYLERGIEQLEAAVAIKPEHSAANLQLGVAYLQAGKGNQAYERLQWAQRVEPQNWEVYYWLAVLHSGVGAAEEALENLETALKLGGDRVLDRARGFPPLAALIDDNEISSE